MSREYRFRTIDFRPAPEGWRYALIREDGAAEVEPLPGWLIEEEVEFGDALGEFGRPTGDRRVIAAHIDWYSLDSMEDVDSFWFVIPPGQPDPTAQEFAAEHARRSADLKETR